MSKSKNSYFLNPSAGLYIHVPFCRSKCPYCDFYSIPSCSLTGRWFESLKKEILLYRNRFTEFDTVYIGGGTPSTLGTGMIEEMLGLTGLNFHISEDAEITIEANPGDMNRKKISRLKSSGINRVNLGVQSFCDRDLLFLGRRHSAADAENAILNLRDAGFTNIGIDLIYGLKGQSIEDWQSILEKALSFKPEHISCYQLTIEGKTVFSAMKNKGELKDISEDLAAVFFMETAVFLERNGYLHYEVSNYSRGNDFKSRHNSKYWRRLPYLGLGPSAHSFDGKKRWWNYRTLKNYIRSLGTGKLPVEDFERLSEEQEVLEKISLGLRTENGIGQSDLAFISGAVNNIQKLKESGHVIIKNGRIVPTKKGLLIADQLPLYIIGND